jgi:hypothetical protein
VRVCVCCSRVVDPAVPPELHARLTAIAHTAALSLQLLSPCALTSLLPLLLPSGWRGEREVPWQPAHPSSCSSSVAQPSAEWIKGLWRWLDEKRADGEHARAAQQLMEWPLLPVCGGRLHCLQHSSRVVQPGTVASVAAEERAQATGQWGQHDHMVAAVQALGCRVLDRSALPDGPCTVLEVSVQWRGARRLSHPACARSHTE